MVAIILDDSRNEGSISSESEFSEYDLDYDYYSDRTDFTESQTYHFSKMTTPVPRPGPAKLGPRSGLPEWLAEAKQCHYLPESAMKQLCEMVKECLMEGRQVSKCITSITMC
jgi:hypothetical protein